LGVLEGHSCLPESDASDEARLAAKGEAERNVFQRVLDERLKKARHDIRQAILNFTITDAIMIGIFDSPDRALDAEAIEVSASDLMAQLKRAPTARAISYNIQSDVFVVYSKAHFTASVPILVNY